MNTMTVVEPTATGTEVDAVPQHDGPTVRVSIREIREYAYRALVAARATPGEAATAASQVLHAELHTGDGLAGLVLDLARGPWSRSGLRRMRRPGGRPVLEVDCGGRSGELRVGAPIVELVAGEAGPAVAVTTADVPVTSLLDEALLAAAVATGTSVTAMRATADGSYVMRHATAEGGLAQGVLVPADVPRLTGVGGMGDAEALVVLTGAAVEPAVVRLSWSTRGERAERRRLAALRGVEAPEATWRVVAQYAQRFLVPEDDS